MPALPLKVQVALRDFWNKPDGSIQANMRKLGELLDCKVSLEPDWPRLITDLAKVYDDKGRLAMAVCTISDAWMRSLIEMLNGNYYPDFAAALGDKIKAAGKLQAFPEAISSRDPSTSWSAQRSCFVIAIPNAAELPQPTELVSVFDGLLPGTLAQTERLVPLASRPAAPAAHAPVADASAPPEEALYAAAPPQAAVPQTVYASQPPSVPAAPGRKFDYMPEVKAMVKPDELLLKPPYYLVLYAARRKEVEVECSHSPTLEFLAGYLKKWCKTNLQSKEKNPAIIVRLHQAAFGLGLLYDRLTLTADDSYGNYFLVTPSVILALVEGILGYERVMVDGSTWTFRKGNELKKF